MAADFTLTWSYPTMKEIIKTYEMRDSYDVRIKMLSCENGTKGDKESQASHRANPRWRKESNQRGIRS